MARIVALVISDRASSGVYEDQGGPAIREWLASAIASQYVLDIRIVPDGRESVSRAVRELCDEEACDLILTTGGTGPSPRDLTPEAMRDVLDKELPGFGELMRRKSLESVPTAILSRQTAGVRGKTLIVNLPGKPASIKTCLDAVFPAIPYCLDLIGAGWIETDPAFVSSFRPGSTQGK